MISLLILIQLSSNHNQIYRLLKLPKKLTEMMYLKIFINILEINVSLGIIIYYLSTKMYPKHRDLYFKKKKNFKSIYSMIGVNNRTPLLMREVHTRHKDIGPPTVGAQQLIKDCDLLLLTP